MKNNPYLFKKLSIYMCLFIFITAIISVAIVYFCSIYKYEKIFEDKIIYQYNKNEEIGICNDWILGVTTHNIDVIEAIHTKKVADHIYQKALTQKEIKKLYRERIGDKYLLYMIELDFKDGEQIYKYSTFKDIYRDTFKKMIIIFVIFLSIIFISFIFFMKIILDKSYADIKRVTNSINIMTYRKNYDHISIDSKDVDILYLAKTFNHLKDRIKEKEDLEQLMLQYISHELKTPVMIIHSYAQSAKDDIFPKGDLNTSLDIIINQTTRIKDRISDLLLISKTNINDEQLKLIDTYALINKTIKTISYLFTDKKIILELEKDLFINGYEKKLSILFENLIHNQLKFSDKHILIKSYRENDNLIFLFENDGDKIEKSLLKNLFKPFYKGYNGSSGLGLSICKGIVKIHKGEIFLVGESENTMFKVILKNG